MPSVERMTDTPSRPVDARLLAEVVDVAIAVGDRLLAVYDPASRPADRAQLMELAIRNEAVSGDGLREALGRLRPEARWVEEEQETEPLPDDGAWWVVDNAEGSVNHVHGLPEWGVSITLVEKDEPVLAVFRQPVGDLTYTALRGGGARRNGEVLAVSAKQGLEIAVVGTGQAEAGQAETYARIGRSVAALLGSAFLVRATVPSTFPMLLVAAGHMDAFWQYEPVLPGVALGALLVREAGGVVTQADGAPWRPGSDSILVAAPGVHAAALDALAKVDR